MNIILQENEKIIKTFSTHKGGLNTVIFLAVFIISGLFFIKLYFNFNFFGYWQILFSAVSIILFIWFLVKLFIWRRNKLIITNERIIYNHQKGLFNKIVTDFLFKDINEVGYEKKGLGDILSNRGTVYIRTGASKVVIHKTPNPSKVVDVINQVRQ